MTKYFTEEERTSAKREYWRKYHQDRYYKSKGYNKGEKPSRDKRKHPCFNMFSNAKKRAKEKGWEFDLVLEEMTIPDLCPLLGIPLFKGEVHYTDNSPTLDRVDSNGGYTKDNVWVISMKANRIKNNASLEELYLIYYNLNNRILHQRTSIVN